MGSAERAAVFDVDGTLVDTGPAHREGWAVVPATPAGGAELSAPRRAIEESGADMICADPAHLLSLRGSPRA
ncbi:hypothetical protein ACFT4A_13950 [Streptomyces sp. NPDC057099]|uniref:HAD family hydrolase n=1 Tax=Streptomyces sp. NPDC057099 TaxID=3346019 RepID=UPI003642C871